MKYENQCIMHLLHNQILLQESNCFTARMMFKQIKIGLN